MAEAETFAFSADINQLLSLIIHTVSHFSRAIFLARAPRARARSVGSPLLEIQTRAF